VVTGQPEREEAARQDPTAFSTVLDTRSAPTEVQTLSEALADTVGVQVRRYGGLGDFSTVSIRGFAPGQVQVYLDGVPLSRAQNEVVNLSDLPLDAIDHVEVYRGATPLAFAQSGPGGVVNIVPRRADGAPVAALSASGGSFATRKVDGLLSGASGPWEALAFAHYLGSAGDFPFETTNSRNLEHPPPPHEVDRQNNAFDLGDFTARVGYRPSGPVAYTLTTDTFAKDEGVPGVDEPQAREASLRTVRQLAHFDAALTPQTNVPLDARGGVYVVYQQQLDHDPLGEINGARLDLDQRSTVAGGQMLVRGALGAHNLPGALVAMSWERFAERDLLNDHTSPAQTRLRATVAAEDEIVLLGERLSLVPGLRWEGFRDDFPGDPFDPSNALQPHGVRDQDFFSPRGGVRVAALPGLTLLANVGRYARVPNLEELFGKGGALIGNANLKPEEAFNRDAGFRFSRSGVTPWLTDVGSEYSFFDNEVDDLIFLQPKGQVTVQPKNLSSAHVRGHEVASRARLWQRVGVAVNYTHQDARNTSHEVADTFDKRIPGLPADEAYARVELSWSPSTPLPFGAAFRALWPGRVWYDVNLMSDNFLDTQNSPDKHVGSRLYHGVGVELSLPARFRVGFEVKNAGNDQTRDAFRFPLPGRSFFGTVSWGFGASAGAENH
jgi:iron complex outermembrane receptor protein